MSTRFLGIVATILMAAVLVLGINQVMLRSEIDQLEDRLGTIARRTLPPIEEVGQDLRNGSAAAEHSSVDACPTGSRKFRGHWCPT